jgi:UDP-glucuronate 4-epimerase
MAAGMKFLVTGAAGFLGMHVCERLLARGDEVIGLDNLNDYYDPQLKRDRLARLVKLSNFRFLQLDITDFDSLTEALPKEQFQGVVHLAAQAGVRYSISHPRAFASSNLSGFVNVLEMCRHGGVHHLVYASSSSVYGGNTKMPFAEIDPVDQPVSLYAATKKANELMAHSYSHLYGIPCTGLRFFTVYGPWGRPDMAYFSFAKAILAGRPINVFNHGDMARDFTYVDDVVEGVVRVLDRPPEASSTTVASPGASMGSTVPAKIFNIGSSSPVPLLEFINILEECLGRKAERHFLPMQDGDVPATYADVSALEKWVQFRPTTSVRAGLEKFVAWYQAYYV